MTTRSLTVWRKVDIKFSSQFPVLSSQESKTG
jgi:hypothetical protein